MKPRTASLVFTNCVAGAALLLSVYKEDPWIALIAALLFVFVLFPRWRARLFRAINNAAGRLARRLNGGDGCDPR